MRTALVSTLAVVFAAGCDVPSYTFDLAAEPADGSTLDGTAVEDTLDAGAETGCTADVDCSATLDTPRCQVTTGKCVQCLESAACGKAQWCNDGACVAGCKDDSDCVGSTASDAGIDPSADGAVLVTKCDPTLHACAGCKTDDQCPLGFLCKSDGVCRPGCSETHRCETGLDCCSGACVDTAKDTANCGGCGTSCATPAHATIKCESDSTGKGTCKIASCATGWADCNATVTDGCETDLLTSLADCGGCGTACTIANGTGLCEAGVCKVGVCNASYGNCDLDDSNGCERSLLADVNDCGACGRVCTVTNGTGACSSGACTVASCNPGFANCDGNAGDCERDFAAATNSCGAPQWIKDPSGYNLCGYGTGDTVSVTTTSTRWYRVQLQNNYCGGFSSCSSTTNPVRARLVLENPSGLAFDLRVYSDSTCSTLVGSSTSGTLGGTETVTYDSKSCMTYRDLWIEVKYRAGSSCSAARLTVDAGYSPYP